MNSYEKKMREYISTQLPNSCETMRFYEANKSRERNYERTKEKEALLNENQIVMKSIKKNKRKLEKVAKFVVEYIKDIKEVEKIHTLLCNKVKMDPNDFMKEYEALISPLFGCEGKNYNPNEICNYLYPAICKRMNEESLRYSMWE